MAIIDRINLGLAKLGKSGSDLEKALGMSNSVYSQWNTGKTKPSKKRLPEIAEFLGVSVEWLLDDEETKKPATDNGDGDDEKLKRNIQYALFDGDKNVTQEDVEAVFNYYKFLQSQRGKK